MTAAIKKVWRAPLSKLSNDASRKNYIQSHHKVLTPPRHDHLGLSLCSFFLPGHSHLHLLPWPKHQSESILPTSVNCCHAVKGQEGKQPFHHANGCSNTFICDKKEPSIYKDVLCLCEIELFCLLPFLSARFFLGVLHLTSGSHWVQKWLRLSILAECRQLWYKS